MIDHRNLERARVFERRAHELRGHHRLAIVAHADCAGVHHLAELRERLTALAYGDGTDGIHPGSTRAQTLSHDEADRRRVVDDWIRIGHRADGGEASCGRRTCAARDRFNVGASRLAQMTVHVDESRRHDQSCAIDCLRVVRSPDVTTDCCNGAIDEQHVSDAIHLLRWIENAPTREKYRARHGAPFPALADSASSGRPPDRRYNTAIRTATPFVTCGSITLWGPSATSESISTPRFIGPG